MNTQLPIKNERFLLRFLATILLLAFTTTQLFSQDAASYYFYTSTGATLDPMTSATTISPADRDDGISVVQNIGFAFSFENINYTQFSASVDGFIRLGGTQAVDQFSNSIVSTTNIPKIFPYWDDLALGTALTGTLKTVLVGTTPNQIRIVEWFVTVPRSTGGAANSRFQLWLYETTNVIEFRYGTMQGPTTSASVGIRGAIATPASFRSVTLTTNTSSTTTANNANTIVPASGRMYTFTTIPLPSINTTGTLNAFTACSGTASTEQSFTVSGSNLTANIIVTPPTGFEVSTTSGSGFASSVTLTQSGGTVTSTTIYTRLTSTATGTPSGNITLTSIGATTQNVLASGMVNGSTTWNGTTWSNGIPLACTDVVIASSTAPASFACKDLIINSTFALTSTGMTATVNGNITNNGNGIAGTGGLTIAANSTISGNAISFNGVLTVNSGATLTTGGLLTLTSNATNTARIANSAGAITGNVTTETYIPGGRRAFRFLGHPFTTAQAMSSLTDDIFVTGDGTVDATGNTTGAGFDATATNDPSSYWFDNTTNTWKAFTTAADASWSQYRGTRILVRGDRTQADALTGAAYTPNAVTLDMTGAVNTGNQNISLPTANNYHLLSNPYPSPTDIGTVIQSASNVGTLYWVWNANAGSRGQYVNRLIADGAYNLAMNGAFFVQPTAATSLAFTEANKQTAATQALYRTATSTRPAGYLELAVKQNNEVADNIYIRDLASALTTKDVEDGGKLINPDINIYTLTSNNEQLTLDARPISSTTVIPVVFTSNMQSSFSIDLIDNGFGNGLPIVLKDKFLNTEHVLTATSPYNFTVTADAASQGTNRFELVFRTSSALSTTFVNVAAQQKGSAIEVTFNTANEQNMHSYEVEESKDGSSFTKGTTVEAKNAATNNYSWLDVNIHNGNNYYRVKAIEKNGAVKYSQVIRVNVGKQTADFTVYPNPVKGGIVNLQLTDIEKGVYTIKVVNNLGQEIAAKQITHNGGSATQTISIGNAPTGKYNMVITNGTTSVTKTVIVE